MKYPYVVSACLAGRHCRYDGGSNPCAAVMRLVEAGLALPVCPESLSGLPIPRPPCEQRAGRVVSRDGTDVTTAFARGAEAALRLALEHDCGSAILKSRSPSCGIDTVYDGSFSRTLIPGQGIWARMLAEAGLRLYSEACLPPDVGE